MFSPVDAIHVGDCEDVLPRLPRGLIKLIVTSPPYPGQRGCDMGIMDWLDWSLYWLSLCNSAMTNDGVIALNVNFARDEDGWFQRRLFEDLPATLFAAGFNLIDVYIWVKTNAVPAGDLSRNDIPAWEPVFLATKAPPRSYPFYPVHGEYSPKTVKKSLAGFQRGNGRYDGGHSDLNPLGARLSNVLLLPTASADQKGRPLAEGGSFPLALPERFILQHTKPGEVVADIFAGVCTTPKAAQLSERHWVGIERDPGEADKGRRWPASPTVRPLEDTQPTLNLFGGAT